MSIEPLSPTEPLLHSEKIYFYYASSPTPFLYPRESCDKRPKRFFRDLIRKTTAVEGESSCRTNENPGCCLLLLLRALICTVKSEFSTLIAVVLYIVCSDSRRFAAFQQNERIYSWKWCWRSWSLIPLDHDEKFYCSLENKHRITSSDSTMN